MKQLSLLVLASAFLLADSAKAQQHLSLKEALQMATDNYGTIKAKANYANASKAGVDQAKREYLPNLNLGVEQAYGTINGQNGPLYAFGGAVASSGPALAKQNWNAAFGALYLANMNWDFFAFGRARDRVRAAQAVAQRDNNDYQQEIFQQKIKVAAAYLNLVAAQRITTSYRKNLLRADTSRFVVLARAKGGLIAGVDSSQANAEISGAKILLVQALNAEQEQAKTLAVLIGSQSADFALDTTFTSRIPADIAGATASDSVSAKHPVLDYYKSRIAVSDKQADYLRTFSYPTFSLQGVFQSRGSGFSSNYITDQTAYSGNYWDGVNPTRSNYLVGVGISWNFTQPFRVAKQVKAQRLISAGLNDEYSLARQELTAQVNLSDKKIVNALTNYREVPVQIKAAGDAWLQKSVLYKNGLTNLVDVTQARYALIRAETDRDIAYNNVWQALLLKAAATGDLNLFVNEL
ncbi:TolC family protein [Mucilaginibacter conchicola]|uniref:TolC family protein n=1 Tax=Mucilaginibacter conchicola TaxID=2303333 RepID=A0A372NZ13_9SPHI|nr:TolC family protein [Mucilaginibacter conchicola]RFZ94909.1 TolC family protein [Mucilaginibacter conchicola]